MINLMRNLFGRRQYTEDRELLAPVRGRVHRVSTLAKGETSVVVRFGLEEAGRMAFRPGQALEVRAAVERPPLIIPPIRPGDIVVTARDVMAGDLARARAGQRFAGPSPQCNCGATPGHPHEPDCIWWNAVDRRQARYDELMGEEMGKPVTELTNEERASPATMEAHERVVVRLSEEDRQAAEGAQS